MLKIIRNVLNAIQAIIVNNCFKEIILDNAYVKKDFMMINRIIFAKNVQTFGKLIRIFYLFHKVIFVHLIALIIKKFALNVKKII